jgi:hypothetical protein
MHRCYYLVTVTVILLLVLDSQQSAAQYFKPGQMKDQSPIELDGSVTAPKLKSNDKNYDSKYKPPDWWIEAWKWAKFFSHLFVGKADGAPSWNNTVASNSIHGPAADDLSTDYNNYPSYTAKPDPNSYLSLGVGIGLGQKGGRFPYAGGTAKESILYFQIPAIMVQYNYKLPAGGGVFAGIGPYYAIALAGRYKDPTISQSLKFGNDLNDDLRRGDFGLKFRAGYALPSQPILISFTADFGLRNLTPGGDNEVKIKNQVLGLQVGYVFLK